MRSFAEPPTKVKPEIFIRCDANSSIGMGHLIRCVSLAEMLKKEFRITFILRDTASDVADHFISNVFGREFIQSDPADLIELIEKRDPAILVLDGYGFDGKYQKTLRMTSCKIAFIDDLVTFDFHCDLILNQASNITPDRYRVATVAEFLLGLDHVLLRPPFLKAAKHRRPLKKIHNIFISFGGADSLNLTYRILKLIDGSIAYENIHILSGPVNQHIDSWRSEFRNENKIHFHNNLNAEEVCSLMLTCELALCPSSSLSLELCACRVPMITGITAENQSGLYTSLVNSGSAFGIGDWRTAKESDIINNLLPFIKEPEKLLNQMALHQEALIDGRSGERILNTFKKLAA